MNSLALLEEKTDGELYLLRDLCSLLKKYLPEEVYQNLEKELALKSDGEKSGKVNDPKDGNKLQDGTNLFTIKGLKRIVWINREYIKQKLNELHGIDISIGDEEGKHPNKDKFKEQEEFFEGILKFLKTNIDVGFTKLVVNSYNNEVKLVLDGKNKAESELPLKIFGAERNSKGEKLGEGKKLAEGEEGKSYSSQLSSMITDGKINLETYNCAVKIIGKLPDKGKQENLLAFIAIMGNEFKFIEEAKIIDFLKVNSPDDNKKINTFLKGFKSNKTRLFTLFTSLQNFKLKFFIDKIEGEDDQIIKFLNALGKNSNINNLKTINHEILGNIIDDIGYKKALIVLDSLIVVGNDGVVYFYNQLDKTNGKNSEKLIEFIKICDEKEIVPFLFGPTYYNGKAYIDGIISFPESVNKNKLINVISSNVGFATLVSKDPKLAIEILSSEQLSETNIITFFKNILSKDNFIDFSSQITEKNKISALITEISYKGETRMAFVAELFSKHINNPQKLSKLVGKINGTIKRPRNLLDFSAEKNYTMYYLVDEIDERS